MDDIGAMCQAEKEAYEQTLKFLGAQKLTTSTRYRVECRVENGRGPFIGEGDSYLEALRQLVAKVSAYAAQGAKQTLRDRGVDR